MRPSADRCRPLARGSLARGRWFLVAALMATTGCSTLRSTLGGYVTGPNGITRSQQRLRQALANGDFARALAWREDDTLLQALVTGAAAFYARQYARSAAVLDTAALLADDRITASLSKDAVAMVTNDMARPYQPRRTERLFLPYYAMLSYVQLGSWEDAAVEARRLVALVERSDDDRDAGETAVHGAMQYLAGAVFEGAGERDAARVAYRAAHSLSPVIAEPASSAAASGDGELLIVVERGFVAHRVTETIELELEEGDRHASHGHEHDRDRDAAVPSPIEATVASTGVHAQQSEKPVSQISGTPPYAGAQHHHHHDDDGYRLTVAYPSLRRSASPRSGAVHLDIDGGTGGGAIVSALIDDASEVDARRERVALSARALGRAAAKYAVTKAIKDGHGEAAGELANLGASFLERADVRSWHVLPQTITLIRARVAAGARSVHVIVGDGHEVRIVDAGPVAVAAGGITILPIRLWREEVAGSSARAY